MAFSPHMYVCKASAGTGKTYTLAAHYIALLMNDVPSRNILAVTFTNKATAEMKQRIITYLNGIANHIQCAETRGFLDCVTQVSKQRDIRTFSYDEYQTKAQLLLGNIMSRFDDLAITTIDSFLQTLLTGLAHAIGQAAGFGVDLDMKHAISTAIDEVLSIEVANNTDTRDTIAHCLQQRLNSEDKWDLRPGLIKITEQLFQESVQQLLPSIPLANQQQDLPTQLIQHFLHSLDEFTHQPPYLTFQRAFSQIQPIAHALEQGKGAKNYHSFLRKCENALNLSGSDEPRLGDSDLNRLQKPDVLTQFTSEQCQLLYQQISIINSCAHDVAQALIKRKVFREHLSNLLLAGRVLKRIHQDQHDGNTFLLAETAQTLVTALGQHDAQFILMKAGIRYQHIMMDEFQDTSTLQWNNFKLLIQEILANGGTALIVGDTKQSIYRWRNGDYEIMNRLHLDPQWQDYFLPHNLSRNFRSQRNIVDFNLSLFDQIRLCNDFASTEVPSMYDESYSPEHLHDFYNDCKQGGYVHYKQFLAPSTSDNETVRNQMLTYMFQQMELLLSLGYQRKDILILCRTSTEAKHVLKLFRHIKADTASYPHLHAAGQIISGDSFLLESSVAVNTIICSLKYLVHQDQVALAYLQLHCPSLHVEALQDLDIHLPFTDLLEQIIRLTLCTDGTYQLQDIAHLNCLRDKIRAYIGQYGSHLESFLQYWDDKMHNDAVPAIESDNIRIMTIHASKGLQAKNVFIPFCAWNKSETSGLLAPTLWCSTSIDDQSMVLPVSYSASMESIPELQAVYQQEKQKQYIDALNLLYVACTRAEDSLYLLYYDAQHTRSAAGSWLRDLFGEEKIVGELMPKQSSSSTTDKIPEPFSFDTAIRQPATYHSNHADIRFRQSQMATQVMRAKALNDSMDNIEFGNLCHAVLEHIQTTDDLEPTLKDFYMRGSIPNQQSMSNIRQLILRLFHHPQAHAWFDGTYQLMREDSVLAYPLHDTTPSIQEFRMDRVMIRHHQAVVLDYKFGKENPEHVLQVQNYMHILHDMGYTDVSGYLWYAFQNNLKQI